MIAVTVLVLLILGWYGYQFSIYWFVVNGFASVDNEEHVLEKGDSMPWWGKIYAVLVTPGVWFIYLKLSEMRDESQKEDI